MGARIALTYFLSYALVVKAEIVLDQNIMQLSLNAAKLSKLSYQANTHPDGSQYGLTMENAHYYNSAISPDMAIVAKVGGYCYASFRGTEKTNLDDWLQNVNPHSDKICNDDGDCCDAREGFVDAYNAPFRDQLEADLASCVSSCNDMNECVVLTGHSQGGAIANVAAVVFSQYSPYVITFGQPGAVHEPCPDIISEKYYRYINTIIDGNKLEHDLVPFAPMMDSSFFGYPIILSPQSDAVASYGLDTDLDILDFHINFDPFRAHSMDGGDYGYIQRIEAVMSHNQYPINSNGWALGEVCSDDGECISGRCDDNICKNLLGSCEACDEDSDCVSGSCYLSKCTRMDLLVDNGCDCVFDNDCASGRCEGYFDWECEAKLGNGHSCSEDSDCVSNNCQFSWSGWSSGWKCS
eukprot:CAMPEP_0185726202 /NCGR_PEP_ID=MMETSP1171-20130828/2255_1 /TAXON_ID=374046 /ORGANISM="Helicotheca tamensis, Strain CCMP826" /LENGTH=408 /DNA_ID=CAMNT_0028394511 /DNA_START=73 /DNA_END=1299 /DNA_ORIENTATION=+